MPRSCCVTNCNNQKNTFRFPKDPEENQRWRDVIPRENIPTHPNTVVCIKHWPEDHIKIKVHGMWKPRDPPSVFECVKKSQIPTRSHPSRPTTKARFEARTSKPDELYKWVEIDHVGNFQAMKDNIQSKEFNVPLFINTNLESEIVLQSTGVLEGTGLPRFLIKILHNHSFEAFQLWC